MKKRILSMLLALAMVLSLLPTAVWANDANTEAVPECICTEACTADSWNPECPVCSASGATPEDCGCYAPQGEDAQTPECLCTEACTADSWNPECPVCSASGATPEDCGCYAPQGEDAQTPECLCTEACTADNWNPECPVCSASDAMPEDCDCYVPDDMALTEEEQRLLEADQSTLSLDEQAALLDAMVKEQALSGEYAVATLDGEGEAGFTFLISTAEQLHDLALKVNNQESYSGGLWASASYRQVGDLDLSGYAEGEGWTPIGTYDYAFHGTYDGSGFQITGLAINRSSARQGLFGCIEGAVIQNVHIVDCAIKGYGTVGALVGAAYTSASTITGCSASGTVSGEGVCVGGIAGFFPGKLSASFSMCAVSGTSFVGGIVGHAGGGLVENCWSSGSADAATKNAGGIAGGNAQNAVVKYCYSTAAVSAPTCAGGIVGQAMDHVEYCVALNPSVTGGANHVAAVETSYGGSIASCYAWDSMTGVSASMQEGVTPITVAGGTLDHQLSEIFGASEVWTFEDNKLPGFGVTYDLPDYMTAEPVEPEKIIEIDSADKLAVLAAGVNTGAEFQLDGKTISAGGEGWTFVQTADIDLSGYAEGDGWTPIGQANADFMGTYDGSHFHITGLTINRTYDYQGLFGYINYAVIKNIHIVDCSITGARCIGALVGAVYGAAITGCSASGTVTGTKDSVGGIAGYAGGRIEASFSTCNVSGERTIGGVAGYASYYGKYIQNCWSSGSVSATGHSAGGIVGSNANGVIVRYCYSTASVSAPTYAGGIVGRAYAPVEHCAALNQSVSGSSGVSHITTGSSQNCYAWDGMKINGSTADLPDGVTPITVTDGTLDHQLTEVFGASDVWTYADNMLPGFGTAYDLPDYMTANKTNTIIIDSVEDLNALTVGIATGSAFSMSGHTIPAGGRGWTFLQTCDIDLSGYSNWTPIGRCDFEGTYDGGGFQITGLTVNSAESYIGLFSYVSGTIENVHVVNCSVQGAAYVGAIAGYLTSTGSITGCSASGMVAGIENGIGGIAGFAAGRISMCSADCTVSGASHIGGIVGYSTGMIANCHSSGYVTASISNAGGIGGTANNTIQNCYSTAAVYGLNSVGGIAGGGIGMVQNCVALNSSVTGESNVQYIVESGDSTAQNSYVWVNMTVTNSYGQVTCISDTITISEGILSTQFSEIFDRNMVWTYADDRLPGLWGDTYDLPDYIASDLPASTVTVDSAEELKALADGLNAGGAGGQAFWFKGMRIAPYGKGWTFLQTCDIDLSQYGEGTGWAPIGRYGFDGTYDGQDYAITGLTINNGSTSEIGLFCRNYGTIQNLSVEGGQIVGFEWTGGIVAQNHGTIQNVHMRGCDIQGNSFTGGIAGLSVGIVRNCSVTGVIDAGGVAGMSGAVGGIVGDNIRGYSAGTGVIEYCYSAVKIHNSKASEASAYGGICGTNDGTIQNCWSLSTVSGPSMVCGLVGSNTRDGSILQCAVLGSSVSYTNSAGPGGRITYAKAGTGSIEQVYAWSGMTVNGSTMEGQTDPCDSSATPYNIGELYVCDGYVYTDKLCTTRLDWSAFGMTEENGWQDTDAAGYLPTRKGAPRIVLDLPQQDSPRPDVNVTVTLTNLTTDFTESTAKQGVVLTMTLTPDAYYLLPETVEVTVGGTGLTAGTDYTYDSTTGLLTIPAANVSGDVTVISAAVPQTFAVTLNLGGGEIEAGKELTSYTYAIGAALPTAITRTGYTFAGWFETEDFSGKAVTEITKTDLGHKTYYAKWTANDYKVTLNTNGGTIAKGSELSGFVFGSGAALPTAITRAGYTLAGWFETEDFTGKAVTEITKTDLGDKTYYAKWTANDYKVTLNTNGGTIAKGSELSGFVFGSGAALPTAITRTGYTFAGWFETEDFSGSAVAEITKTDLGHKTYYAKWDIVTYDILYVLDGGSNAAANPSVYTVTDSFTLTAPVREGYSFTGWTWEGQTEPKLTVQVPAGTTGTLRFTAHWQENEKPPIRFIDVDGDDWFYDPVYWAVETGITTGTTDTTFSPKDHCTRAHMVTFLWRAAGSPEPTITKNPFTDVSESSCYYKAIVWAVEHGITNGTSRTTFSPNAPCTRAQIVTFLWRYAGTPRALEGGSAFLDLRPGSYYEEAVLWAAQQGIAKGVTSTIFRPNGTCTRAQGVTFLYRFFHA